MVILTEKEIIPAIICVGVIIFIVLNRLNFRRVKSSRIILFGFYSLCGYFFFGILEEFFLGYVFNIFQHLSTVGATTFLAFWTWKVSREPETSQITKVPKRGGT